MHRFHTDSRSGNRVLTAGGLPIAPHNDTGLRLRHVDDRLGGKCEEDQSAEKDPGQANERHAGQPHACELCGETPTQLWLPGDSRQPGVSKTPAQTQGTSVRKAARNAAHIRVAMCDDRQCSCCWVVRVVRHVKGAAERLGRGCGYVSSTSSCGVVGEPWSLVKQHAHLVAQKHKQDIVKVQTP